MTRAGAAPPPGADPPLARIVRDEGRAVLAVLARRLGDLGLAEDAVQEAVLRAHVTWAHDGVPANPRAWLMATARNKAIDLVRRESTRTGREEEAMRMLDAEPDPPPDSAVEDDLLRLVFTCCHPSLSPEAQVALSLRTLCGLTTAEVARALLTSESTMSKRLTRARHKIAVAGIPYRVPRDHELPDRLGTVATTVYLVFNEGYSASAGDDHLRVGLAEEAIRLGRLLLDLLPGEPSLQGLLALMLLQHARSAARLDDEGRLVLLPDQDRSLWDRDAVVEGVTLVGDGLRRTPDRPDPYLVQAAIASCHDLSDTWEDTPWPAIVSWYDVLLGVADTPIVRLNRAAAVAELEGPLPALALVEAIEGLDAYVPWQATRAELLERVGRPGDAADAYAAALALPMTESQRCLLGDRLASLS